MAPSGLRLLFEIKLNKPRRNALEHIVTTFSFSLELKMRWASSSSSWLQSNSQRAVALHNLAKALQGPRHFFRLLVHVVRRSQDPIGNVAKPCLRPWEVIPCNWQNDLNVHNSKQSHNWDCKQVCAKLGRLSPRLLEPLLACSALGEEISVDCNAEVLELPWNIPQKHKTQNNTKHLRLQPCWTNLIKVFAWQNLVIFWRLFWSTQDTNALPRSLN